MSKEWVRCGTHDNYPVIELDFADGVSEVNWVLLFDTGADHTYLNADALRDEHIELDDLAIQSVPARGEDLFFYPMRIRVVVHDGVNSRVGSTQIRAVEDWDNCFLSEGCKVDQCDDLSDGDAYCRARNALISPRILKDLEISIELDGMQRSLTISGVRRRRGR